MILAEQQIPNGCEELRERRSRGAIPVYHVLSGKKNNLGGDYS